MSFPRPKTLPPPKDDKSERESSWKHRLLNLPKQQFVLHTPSSDQYYEVKAAEFPVNKPERPFLDAVLRKCSTPEEVGQTFARRLQRIEDIVESERPSQPAPKAEPTKRTKVEEPTAQPVAGDWGLDD